MRTDSGVVQAGTIEAAQAGDRRAREELAADCLPLVYNIVGRALNGHADVDDVVQETLLRVLDGLGGLREPARFRPWLVAIAMNEVRRRWSLARRIPTGPLEESRELPDPAADFVDLTILRLGLSGQRKEIAEATRWLDPEDQEVLTLWWLEASGRLSRPELAEALTLTPQHAAVRIQRMKERLEIGRVIVRALAADPRCPELAALTSSWDGAPSPIWRKRLARHTRECPICSTRRDGLIPAEALLAGLLLIPPPPMPHVTPAAFLHATHATHGAHGVRGAHAAGRSVIGKVPMAAAAGGVAVALAAGGMWAYGAGHGGHPKPKAAPPAVSSQVVVPSVLSTSAAPTPTPTPTHPSPTPTKRSPTPARRTTEQQVIALVNAQRSQHGCGPVHADPALHNAAQRHTDEMAARNTLSHTGADGSDPGARITAAGYSWSGWGENIAEGQSGPTSVMGSWMASPGHRANILNCSFQAIGVGFATGSGVPWWTQDFGTPG